MALSFPLLALQMLLLVAMRNGMGSGRITSLMATPFTEQLDMGRIAVADVPI